MSKVSELQDECETPGFYGELNVRYENGKPVVAKLTRTVLCRLPDKQDD